MRVLMLHQRHLPTLKSGLVEYFNQLIPKLKSRGVTPIFLTAPEKKQQHKLQYFGEWLDSPCYLFPFPKPRWFHFKSEYQPILDLCKELQIDLLHAHGAYRTGYTAKLIASKKHLPYIVTSHSDISEDSARTAKKSVKKRLAAIFQQANWVTHLTPPMQKIADRICDTQNKSTVIGNGIDLENWENKLNIPNCHYFFSIGRLVKEKGFHILIQAYAQLCSQLPNENLPHLVIAGSGEEEKALRELALSLNMNIKTHIRRPQELSSLPPKQIIFTGTLNTDEKKIWYRAASLFLFAPVWLEPFGLVQLEAAAAGTPIVACSNPTTQYFMQAGLFAHIISENKPGAWAQELKQILIENRLSELNQQAQKNRELMQQFSWDHTADEYVKVYQRVLDQH